MNVKAELDKIWNTSWLNWDWSVASTSYKSHLWLFDLLQKNDGSILNENTITEIRAGVPFLENHVKGCTSPTRSYSLILTSTICKDSRRRNPVSSFSLCILICYKKQLGLYLICFLEWAGLIGFGISFRMLTLLELTCWHWGMSACSAGKKDIPILMTHSVPLILTRTFIMEEQHLLFFVFFSSCLLALIHNTTRNHTLRWSLVKFSHLLTILFL